MTFEQWQAGVSTTVTGDSLWKSEAYRLALFAADLAWHDVTKLVGDRRTIGLADQLYRAVGSVSANFSEGYSRQSPKDQARFYEYSLGSAREARGWYYKGRHVLTERVTEHRMQLLTQVIRLLLTIIPAERGFAMKDEAGSYSAVPRELLDVPPLPEGWLSPTANTQHATRNPQHPL
ncbi:MAG: four helix bundle protein [Pedosphaera sp. Tous-C6FEB]|nr:MAG: four helix bundle protein [Pedosphaera sp. Tous-C6FEB]